MHAREEGLHQSQASRHGAAEVGLGVFEANARLEPVGTLDETLVGRRKIVGTTNNAIIVISFPNPLCC